MSGSFEQLKHHLPEGCLQLVEPWFERYPVQLRISKPRRTKLGDFRSESRNGPHRISVNSNLNPYSFLITLIHEFAHVATFSDHGRRAKAHGEEWKRNYREMLYPFLLSNVFPEDLEEKVRTHLNKAPAASCSDPELVKALHKFDKINERTYLEELPSNSVFSLGGDRVFRKGEKLRKRYKCMCLNNSRTYLIDPLAEVKEASI